MIWKFPSSDGHGNLMWSTLKSCLIGGCTFNRPFRPRVFSIQHMGKPVPWSCLERQNYGKLGHRSRAVCEGRNVPFSEPIVDIRWLISCEGCQALETNILYQPCIPTNFLPYITLAYGRCLPFLTWRWAIHDEKRTNILNCDWVTCTIQSRSIRPTR